MRHFKSSFLSTLALILGLSLATAEQGWAQHPLKLQERAGLSLMVNVGPGFQHVSRYESSGTGLGRVSLGVGDFLKHDLGVFLRFSVTSVEHSDSFFLERNTSGFGGISLQFWQSSRFFIETGLGVGFTSDEARQREDAGISVLVGSGVTMYDLGRSNVYFGFEYSPALISSEMVHTLGLKYRVSVVLVPLSSRDGPFRQYPR